jgi:hypothetical protein
MKHVCAWCGKTIKITCHCGAPLLITSYVGSTFDRGSLVCLNGETILTYSTDAIEKMPVTHGLCPECANLTREERDHLLTIRRNYDATLPSAQDLDKIAAERELADHHEAETRSIAETAIPPSETPMPPKKRGPRGVTRSATAHPGMETEKDDGAA